MGKYIVIYPVFGGSENFFFDTLEEVKQNIEVFTKADSYEEKAKVRVCEIRREIDVKSILSGRAGRGIRVEVMDNFPTMLKYKNCLCCGHHTLTSDIHDICSNCEWQDDPSAWEDIDYVTPANGISLRQARNNYEKYGNCDGIVDEPIEEEIKILELKSSSEILKERNRIFKERNETHIKEAKEFLEKKRDEKGHDK